MCISAKEYAKAHGLVERTLGEYFYKKERLKRQKIAK